jgi:endonuclease VIII
VLDEATTPVQIAARLMSKAFYRRQFASLLLDQGFLCGLGNYLRSEILFVAKVHPSLRPFNCSEAQILRLAEASIGVTHQSYRTKGITNDLRLAQQLKAEGKRRRDYRHFVFGRQDKPCYVCGTAIVKEILAGRRLYYCPTCQQK